LHRERFANLRLKSTREDFGFARQVNLAPLGISEFVPASREHPVFFVEGADRELQAIALLGLRQNQNRSVDPSGRWRRSYIPAYIRCYPFILGGDGNVYIEEAVAVAGDPDGEALFDAQGGNSEVLNRYVSLLAQYQQELKQSQEFCRWLRDHGLLKSWGVQVIAGGEQVMLDGVQVIDVKRFGELEDSAVCELFRAGHLALAYAHLFSLGNVARLSDRAAANTTNPA
jgi:hypothetical protein